MATDQENTRDKEGQCCQKCDDKTCGFDKRQYNRKMIRLLIERANYLSKLYGYPIYGTVLKRVSWDQASGFVEKDLVVLADGAGGGILCKVNDGWPFDGSSPEPVFKSLDLGEVYACMDTYLSGNDDEEEDGVKKEPVMVSSTWPEDQESFDEEVSHTEDDVSGPDYAGEVEASACDDDDDDVGEIEDDGDDDEDDDDSDPEDWDIYKKVPDSYVDYFREIEENS
jgi:hypothetical protein